MPLYEFRCKKCSAVFEHLTKNKKAPPCPECESAAVERLLSAPGVIFKGSGFYKTDSRGPAPSEKK